MKKILLGKDWKTSAAGIGTALAVYAKMSDVTVVDWKSAVVSLGIFAIGRLASDQTRTKEERDRDAERFPNS